MNFSLSQKSPIGVTIDGVAYRITPFLRRDWAAWAADVDAERLTRACEHLTPESRAKLLLIFPQSPVDHSELTRQAFAPSGTARIIRTCAARSGVPHEIVEKLLEEGDDTDVRTLALLLASIVDRSEIPDAADTGEAKGEPDPLASAPPASKG
jgi:hypothetical protein